jgi:hypothetical protein
MRAAAVEGDFAAAP